MLVKLAAAALLTILPAATGPASAQFDEGADPDLEAMLGLSLAELMEQPVFLASGVEETLADAPAATIVVTAEEIARRGYSDLSQVLADLPGFDVVVANGTSYANAYQRGYRTPFTQRTLLMIDGKVDNHLWSHMAQLSRQYPMADVERIEVLYGPASAVYGANAFLGIVNVVTRAAPTAGGDRSGVVVNAQVGSWETVGLDAAARGRSGDVEYSMAARVFRSDEPDLSGRWGYNTEALYADRSIWGPLLDVENNGQKLGSYADPTDDYGLRARLRHGGLSLSLSRWETREGYGSYYPADRAQNNVFWENASSLVAGEYEAQVSDRVDGRSLLQYRNSLIGGWWAEALPDGEGSWVSLTPWRSSSHSWLFEQHAQARVRDGLEVQAGLKYERKELTRAYDIGGYWGAFSSNAPSEAPGPHGYGVGVYHSTDSVYAVPPMPAARMPAANLALTSDYGGYVQAIVDTGPYRIHAGLRHDHNSVYGSTVNPRLSLIWRLAEQGALKLMYGEAFQEPAPIQLWGGWSGRQANPELAPERVRNVEAVAMYDFGHLLLDGSLYRAHYRDVIKEEAENAGQRTVHGLELRSRFSAANPLSGRPAVSGYAYYTFTHSSSSIYYDHDAGAWGEGDRELGDIAPHKISAGADLPLTAAVDLFVGGNWSSSRKLYLRNPLRAQGDELESHLVLNGNVSYRVEPLTLSLRVDNLLDLEYSHPGVEAASSGQDFERRSLGWMNSLIPQPGRRLALTARLAY